MCTFCKFTASKYNNTEGFHLSTIHLNFQGSVYHFVHWHPWTHHTSAARAWKWKWSNGVEKSETDLCWCISMTNNVKSYKKTMEESKHSDSVFLQWDCAENAKRNTKTRETKTQITQNFEKVWPIQSGTMWKLTSWGFRKCGSFWRLELLNHSYQPPK